MSYCALTSCTVAEDFTLLCASTIATPMDNKTKRHQTWQSALPMEANHTHSLLCFSFLKNAVAEFHCVCPMAIGHVLLGCVLEVLGHVQEYSQRASLSQVHTILKMLITALGCSVICFCLSPVYSLCSWHLSLGAWLWGNKWNRVSLEVWWTLDSKNIPCVLVMGSISFNMCRH